MHHQRSPYGGGYPGRKRYNRDYNRPDWRGSEGSQGRRFKRRKYDSHDMSPSSDEIENRLNSLIVRIGDKSSSPLENNLQGLADALEGDISTHKKQIVTMIFTCVKLLPVKIPVYGTLVGLLNVKNFDFGKDVVRQCSIELEKAFMEGNNKNIKYLIRFLGELLNANVILPAALLSLFEEMLSVVPEDAAMESSNLTEAPTSKGRSSLFAYVIMITLPYVGQRLFSRHPDELEHIIENLSLYLSKSRKVMNPAVTVYNNEEVEEYNQALWKEIIQLKEDGWQIKTMFQPYKSFQGILDSAAQHELPNIDVSLCPVDVCNDAKSMFRLFNESKVNQGMRRIDRFVLEDAIVDLLYHFSGDHKLCSKFLLCGIPFPVPSEFLLIEVIFGQLFLLPEPPFKQVFYAVLIGDLCRVPSIPPVLGKAIDLLFGRLDHMDSECIDRFVGWFSHHLSNFEYKWHWSKWSSVLRMKEDTHKRLFVREVLENCMRLSYFERVARTIPEDFMVLMPPKPQPEIKYTSEHPDYALYKQILLMMRQKKDGNTIHEWCTNSEVPPENLRELLVTALTMAGAKSFSHFLNMLERYNHLLRQIISNQKTRLQVVCVVTEFWKNSALHRIISLDKLMTYRIIDNLSIVNWIFSAEVLPDFKRGYVWEILRNTINKTIARTQTVRKQLESCRSAAHAFMDEEDDNKDAPEVVKLRQTEAALETALREQKELLLVVFQRFTISISNHLTNCEARDADPYDYWYYSALGHLKEIGRKYRKEIKPFKDTLENILFTSEVDSRITDVFHQFRECI
eukprot:CAMPEP_0174265190 /NCGR_PEP_ID=MMETSP0439-20130205/25516_1 /TAXON_ID=0 /ORGANISM="Stereomyxa ramosa, Strain Chinc5" /LENGTH=793 /DNA_ID=CAMNT_0015351511 /DNA_START=36 /DNA_END=2417 /DNA_ORIENTATION=-